VDSSESFEKDNYVYNLNMAVRMSMTKRSRGTARCDPSSGGYGVRWRVDSVGEFHRHDQFRVFELGYRLSCLSLWGRTCSYETVITGGCCV
jgi:hypothetical protein